MSRIRLTAGWSTLGLAVLLGCLACHVRAKQSLDPAIGPPVPAKYKAVRDAPDWLNPYLSVCPQGVVLSVRSVNQVYQTVQIAALRDSLLALPSSAWPYGRIVALQDCSIGVPGDAEERKARMQAVESILKGLKLNASRWPS